MPHLTPTVVRLYETILMRPDRRIIAEQRRGEGGVGMRTLQTLVGSILEN